MTSKNTTTDQGAEHHQRRMGLLSVHTAALLFGGTALFSKLIVLPAELITIYRTFIALPAFVLITLIMRVGLLPEKRWLAWAHFGLGVILGIHWYTYFKAMQVSTVAIGLISLFTAPVLTTLLEPLFGKGRYRLINLGLAVMATLGVVLLARDFGASQGVLEGIALGVGSAILLSFRNILHHRMPKIPGSQAMIYQMAGIMPVFIWVPFVIIKPVPMQDIGYLVLLGLFFTALPHGLIAVGLNRLSGRTVTLTTAMMVLHGILLAWLILGEPVGPWEIGGGALVVGAAILDGLYGHDGKKKVDARSN